MTDLATTTGTAPRTALPELDGRSGAGFLTATGQSARRTSLQYLRTPELLLMPVIMAAMFLLVFRYVFGGAITTGTTFDYVDFLVPGFLVQTIVWTLMAVPAGVAEDASSGVNDRFRSLPIRRIAVPTGRSLADATLISFTLLVTSALGLAVGFRTHAGAAEVIAAYALMVLMAFAFTWVFISVGLAAKSAQAAQGLSTVLIVPLTFVSSAFVPMDSMPGWMQSFAANQPVTVMINAVRSLMLGGSEVAGIGHSTGHWVALTLAWCSGLLVVFSAYAGSRFARTR